MCYDDIHNRAKQQERMRDEMHYSLKNHAKAFADKVNEAHREMFYTIFIRKDCHPVTNEPLDEE